MRKSFLDELKATTPDDLMYQAVYLLGSLIAIPSLCGGGKQSIDFLENFLRERYNITTMRNNDNIWCYNKRFDLKKPTLLLTCEVETTSPDRSWSRDPLSPAIVDGKLFGLGSNDPGASLVSLLSAFLYFYPWKALPFNICLEITSQKQNIEGSFIMPDLMPISFAIVGAPTEMVMGIDKLGSIALDSPSIGVSTLVRAGRNIGRSTFLLPITSDRSLIKVPFLTMGPGSPLKSASGDEFIYLSQIREGIELFIKMIQSLNMLMNQDSACIHSK